MPFYESVALRCEIEVYDGADASKIIALAGQENASQGGGVFQVRARGGRWVTVEPGFAVRRVPGGVFVLSGDVLAEDWRQVP